MKISVLTATYNRAKYLERLYKSIVSNMGDNYEIEWLIMDDGSTDNTEAEVKMFDVVPKLQIMYYKQNNMGKMAAINNLSGLVTGNLWIECDSDDYFADNAFSKIIESYEKCEKKDDLYAFAFLKENQNGENMGKAFHNKKSTMFDLYFKEQEDGEKALVFISDVRKKYRYELEENERFVTEARMYHKMDRDYKICCVNETIMVCEYQEEGYSKNIERQFIKNPCGYYKYFYEILANMDMKGVLFSKRLYVIKHYILFTYLTNRKLNLKVNGFANKLLIVALYVPGIIKSKKYSSSISK